MDAKIKVNQNHSSGWLHDFNLWVFRTMYTSTNQIIRQPSAGIFIASGHQIVCELFQTKAYFVCELFSP